MNFAALAAGDAAFLDANVFVYHFAPDPVLGPPCSGLLGRIERQEIEGYTSTHVLTEATHRLMTIEASHRFGWPLPGIVSRLRKHAGQVQTLGAFRHAVEAVLNSRIKILGISSALVVAGAVVSQQTGLLSNDALIVAVMQQSGLTRLASNDADFDRVPWLSRYAPA